MPPLDEAEIIESFPYSSSASASRLELKCARVSAKPHRDGPHAAGPSRRRVGSLPYGFFERTLPPGSCIAFCAAETEEDFTNRPEEFWMWRRAKEPARYRGGWEDATLGNMCRPCDQWST